MTENEAYWKGLIVGAVEDECERNDLDFKADLSEKNERLKEHINAFANTTGGGCFVYGLDETKSPLGYTGDKINFSEIQQKISSLSLSTQEPSITVKNFTVKTKRGNVLALQVVEGVTLPVFIVNRAPFGGKACFKRTGANTVPIPNAEIRILLAQSTEHYFDETPVQGATIEDLDFVRIGEAFQEFKIQKGADAQNLEILLERSVLCKIENTYHPTVAGFLIFGKAPQSIRVLSNTYIEFQKYAGVTRANPIRKIEIKGNIQEQLERSIELLMESLWYLPKIGKDGKRVEIPAYDRDIVREVMTNALVHRDYTKLYHPVKIALFDDRVEVENIGGLLPGLTTLNFINKRAWRNPLLANLTKRVGFGEMDGQGIDRIVSLARKIQVPYPVFKNEENSFVAILYGPKPFDSLEPHQKRLSVIFLLIFEREIDNELLRNSFDIKPEQATNLIKSMVEEGIIVSANKSRRFAKYKFSEKFSEKINS